MIAVSAAYFITEYEKNTSILRMLIETILRNAVYLSTTFFFDRRYTGFTAFAVKHVPDNLLRQYNKTFVQQI